MAYAILLFSHKNHFYIPNRGQACHDDMMILPGWRVRRVDKEIFFLNKG